MVILSVKATSNARFLSIIPRVLNLVWLVVDDVLLELSRVRVVVLLHKHLLAGLRGAVVSILCLLLGGLVDVRLS